MSGQTDPLQAMQSLLQAALNEAETERQANKRKSDQIAAISHDIRTSMGAIISTTELLLGTALDETQKSYARATLESSQNLLGVLNQILDLSKLESGELELENIAFDPAELVESAAKAMRSRIEDKGLTLQVELPANKRLRLLGDPTQLRQLLLNLVDNAIKFTDKGSITIRVSAKDRGDEFVLRFEVIDTGIGLEPEQEKALFAPYQQAGRSVARHYGGTGLGLSLVRKLSQLMGGEAGVVSRKGAGSNFWFTVQCRKAEVDETPDKAGDENASNAVEPESADDTAEDDAGPAHILVAEDNQINRMLITTYLEKFGHSFETVDNGREAAEAAKSGAYDLILMDIHMPVMDGVEAAKQIRADEAEGQHVPIIALTANAMKGDRDNYLAAGMDEYVSKPIDARDLFMKIDALVRRRSAAG